MKVVQTLFGFVVFLSFLIGLFYGSAFLVGTWVRLVTEYAR